MKYITPFKLPLEFKFTEPELPSVPQYITLDMVLDSDKNLSQNIRFAIENDMDLLNAYYNNDDYYEVLNQKHNIACNIIFNTLNGLRHFPKGINELIRFIILYMG